MPSCWAHPQATEGVTTRSVRDTAALLDVLSRREPGSLFAARHELQRVAAMQDWARAFCRFWSDYDVLVRPTTPFPAQPVEDWQPNPDDPMEPWSRWGPVLDYAEPFNRSGQPALSVPGAVVDGLPYGVQLGGRHGQDAVLLQLAAALEETTPLPCWPVVDSATASLSLTVRTSR